MGLIITKLSSVIWGSKKLSILLLGLDRTGKTTLLFKLKLANREDTTPTIGFNVETVEYRNVSFIMWDLGVPDNIRAAWKPYLRKAQALIFVVDSCDRDRMAEARDELHRLLAEDELRDVKVLVFANKQDMLDAVSVGEVTEKLQLGSLRNRQLFVQGSSGITGEGIRDGLDWLASALS